MLCWRWLILAAGRAQARINVVTLPGRDSVQLTVYNSADLTMVKETRTLMLRKGLNRLEFSWANTLIDPTSVEFRALTHADEVDVLDVSFPAAGGQHAGVAGAQRVCRRGAGGDSVFHQRHKLGGGLRGRGGEGREGDGAGGLGAGEQQQRRGLRERPGAAGGGGGPVGRGDRQAGQSEDGS